MTSELNEGLHHLGKAAKSGGQVAKQTYATAKPHIDKAVATLAEMPSNGKKSAKKLRQTRREARRAVNEANRRAADASLALRGQKQRRWPLTMIALAGGLVLGGAASLLSKRLHELQNDPFATMETHPAS